MLSPPQEEGIHKRKGPPSGDEDQETDASQGISPTWGIEFFANRTRRASLTQILMPASGQSSGVHPQTPTNVSDRQQIRSFGDLGETESGAHALSTASCTPQPPQGLGTRVTSACHEGLTDLAEPPVATEHSSTLHSPREKETIGAVDQARLNLLYNNEIGKLMPVEPFLVTVCSKGNQPVEVMVRPGSTIGQLSQAEAGLDAFVQPIVITTMTGVPLPLASWLTPAAWYIVDNGATHAVPRCADIHAEPECVLTVQSHDRIQGLLLQGPLVAVDEMTFYAAMIRNQGYRVADPIIVDHNAHQDQALATWVLEALHEHESNANSILFQVPVLVRSHWVPVVLRITSSGNVVVVPHEAMAVIQNMLEDECGSHEFTFEASTMPTAFPADCGFQTVNCMFAQVVGTQGPKPILPVPKQTTGGSCLHFMHHVRVLPRHHESE